jgi:hypothetical protein
MRLAVVPAQLSAAARSLSGAHEAVESLRVAQHLMAAVAAVPGGRLAVVASAMADGWAREVARLGSDLARHADALTASATRYRAVDERLARTPDCR